jgi:hypothetical protein
MVETEGKDEIEADGGMVLSLGNVGELPIVGKQ